MRRLSGRWMPHGSRAARRKARCKRTLDPKRCAPTLGQVVLEHPAPEPVRRRGQHFVGPTARSATCANVNLR